MAEHDDEDENKDDSRNSHVSSRLNQVSTNPNDLGVANTTTKNSVVPKDQFYWHLRTKDWYIFPVSHHLDKSANERRREWGELP